MNLLSQPFDPFIDSTESQQLAELLAPNLKQHLKLQRFSKPKYHYHLNLIVLNLYQSWSSNQDKCVGISRRKNYYDEDQGLYQNKKLSHTYMTKTLDGLDALKYIDKVRGGWRDPETGQSETSRYRASKALIDLFSEYDLNQQSIVRDKAAVAVRLRGKKPRKTKTKRNPRGKLISYRPTKKTKAMTKNLKIINEALNDTDINLYVSNAEMKTLNKHMQKKHEEDPNELTEIQFSRKWLYRVFNESFEKGGRFYGGFWQEIRSTYRSRITIDHCATTEIDFDSLHPAMLYLQEGYKKEAYLDPYQLTKSVGVKILFREVRIKRNAIKLALNTMLNSKSYKEALGSLEASKLKAPKEHKSWESVIEAIQQCHEPIAHNFYKGVGLELQALDSQIVEKVLLDLIEQNTIALPVHDSFLCKLKDMKLLIKKMNEATEQYLGSDLFITLELRKLEEPTKALTVKNSNFYKRRNNYLKRFNTQEDPKEPYLV